MVNYQRTKDFVVFLQFNYKRQKRTIAYYSLHGSPTFLKLFYDCIDNRDFITLFAYIDSAPLSFHCVFSDEDYINHMKPFEENDIVIISEGTLDPNICFLNNEDAKKSIEKFDFTSKK